MRGFPKAEPGENKGDTGLLTGLGIAVGVSDVNWVRDGVAFYDETDIFGLVFAAAARTFVVEEAVAKTSGPVSYTHLDVYKRQIKNREQRPCGACDFLNWPV